jgi:effector-binding domain-containing protein
VYPRHPGLLSMSAGTAGRQYRTDRDGGYEMSQEPQIQARPAQHYAAIPATVTMEGISGAVDDAFPALFGWLAGQGIAPSGPPFIRYLVIDMAAELDIELAAPVAAPVRGSGQVRPGILPPGRYAVLRHAGSYDGLVAGHAALQEWAREHGTALDSRDTARGTAWGCRAEHYLTDPSAEPDPAKWEVDIAYLISGA